MRLAHTLRLPYPGYILLVFRNSVVLWVLVRLFLISFIFFFVQADVATAIRQPSLGIPAALVWVDRKRSHEQLLSANLGASELWFWALSLLVSFGLDLLAFIVLGPA